MGMMLKRGVSGFNGLKRFGEISRVLAKHGFGMLFDRMRRKRRPPDGKTSPEPLLPAPHRLRRALEELGPSFIKLGQLISTRADLFPQAYIDELQKLQDQVPPLPADRIIPFLEKELNHSLDQIFDSFDETPIAAASVAQVYKADLIDGEAVAVKVIRPGIHHKIRQDIRVMYYFAQKFEKSFEMARILGAVNVVKEFERTIFNELDMHIEAGSIDKFARHYRNVREIRIPAVHWDFTTKNVLVMTYIPGVKVNQVDAIREQGTDPCDVARIGLRSLSRQLMEFGLVHADPHPGNTIVMPDGRVGLVDFGITASLDEEIRTQLAYLFIGYAEHDYDLVMRALIDAGLLDENRINLKNFRNDLKEVSEPFYGRSLQTISVKDVYEQIIGLVLKYRIQLPRNLLLLLKTFIQTESLGKILGSNDSILEVIRPYARAFIKEGQDSQKIFRTLERDVFSSGSILRRVPSYLHDILRQAAGGRHRLAMVHTGFDEPTRKLEKGLNRLIVCVIIASSTIAGAMVLNSKEKIFEFQLPWFDGLVFSLTSLLGVMGYSIATLLGIWLIFSIFRSGKL